MNEVSCRVCPPILDAVEARGGSPQELVDGLAFDLADLRRPSNRIGWDDFTVLLERAADALGGVAALERLAVEHTTT